MRGAVWAMVVLSGCWRGDWVVDPNPLLDQEPEETLVEDTAVEDTAEDTAEETDTDTDTDADTDTDTDTGSSGPPTSCWTVASGTDGTVVVLEVEMDTGKVSEHGRFGSSVSSVGTKGLAAFGGDLVMVSGGQFVHVDMTASAVTVGPEAGNLDALSSDGARLFATDAYHGLMCAYASYADLVSGNHGGCVAGFAGASRFAPYGASFYGAWHSTDEVGNYSRATGLRLGTVPLPDWDTWVWGISVAADMVHLIDDGRGDWSGGGIRIARYDFFGTLVSDVILPKRTETRGKPSGLWCWVP